MARPSFRAAPVRVQVPATSANLGPGFDSLALALGRHDDVVVRVADSGLSLDVAGEGANDLPRTARHLVARSLRAAFDALGGQPRGLEIVCANRIPQARGLGSSAAAIVAGIVAARELVLGGEDLLDDAAALALAARLEGHPDNVAACLLGGLTVAWTQDGTARAVRLEPVESLQPVAFVPATRSSTSRARRALPATVPHTDAAHSAGRAALLVVALTQRPDLLLDATEDRLHQDSRALAMPRTAALVRKLRAAAIPAVVSGAGPTVLALATSGADLSGYAGKVWEVVSLPVDRAGAAVRPLHG
ncbi:MAG: homoserine kinase [Actinomycetota bacterium]|nr:homoserine kinase [Actinomycetota bacterium]